ncbi:MAG: hypothetical protein J0H99_20960, partial [Rhodospirillales bacterium]|nr:hypothetical protein [Rhodospirillales bacterium]
MVDIENPVDQIVDRAAEFLLGAQGGNIQDAAARFPVDLKAAPFNLDDAAVQWVESTIGTMSLEEKIGQLFINHNNDY